MTLKGKIGGAIGTMLKIMGSGAGAFIAWQVFELLKLQPGMLGDALRAIGGTAATAIVLGGLVIWRFDKRAGEFITEQRELTGTLNDMVKTRARENELVLDSMAANFTELLNAQRDMREDLKSLVIEVGKLKGRAGVEL